MVARDTCCSICGKSLKLQGLSGHMRRLHRVSSRTGLPVQLTAKELEISRDLVDGAARRRFVQSMEDLVSGKTVEEVRAIQTGLSAAREALRSWPPIHGSSTAPITGEGPTADVARQPPAVVTIRPDALVMPEHEVREWGRSTGVQFWGRSR